MAEKYTESQKRASLKYQANKAQIKITVSPDQRERYQKLASSRGISLTELITQQLGGLNMNIKNRTIKSIFEFGFEEIEQQNIIVNDNKYIYHLSDFTEGKMKKYYNYTVGRFENNFCCILSFR